MPVACFYLPQFAVAVERARLNQLWGEPVGLSTADGRLAAVSDEAALYGIRAGQSVSSARALCPRLLVLPYDRTACESAAHPIWDLFAIESSVVEPVSPEVCYVELTGQAALERVQSLARRLAASVRIPVLAGFARSKFVAYRAAVNDKEERVVSVPAGAEAAYLASIAIEQIPNLDYKLRQRLIRLGVKTLGDLQRIPRRALQRQFKEIGVLLQRLAVGEDGDPVRPLWPPRAIEKPLDFEDETADSVTIHEALRRCAESAARQLAGRSEYGRSLTLRVSLADGSCLEAAEKLVMPASSTAPLHRAALRLLNRLDIEQPLLGVALRVGDLGAGSGLQLALLDDNRRGRWLPHERRRSLEATLACLRKRFGPGCVLPLGLLRQAKRIGLWTYPFCHQLHEPIEVATDARGRPVRYWRRGRWRDVKRIHDRWRETEWFWDSVQERTVYRVETDPAGLSELHQLNARWLLRAIFD